MKPKFKIKTHVQNKNNDYTPIHVTELLLASDRRKKNPYVYLTVGINLVHGFVEVRTCQGNGSLTVRPFTHRMVRVEHV